MYAERSAYCSHRSLAHLSAQCGSLCCGRHGRLAVRGSNSEQALGNVSATWRLEARSLHTHKAEERVGREHGGVLAHAHRLVRAVRVESRAVEAHHVAWDGRVPALLLDGEPRRSEAARIVEREHGGARCEPAEPGAVRHLYRS